MSFVLWERLSLSLWHYVVRIMGAFVYRHGTMSSVSWKRFSLSLILSLPLYGTLWKYVVRIMGAFSYRHG